MSIKITQNNLDPEMLTIYSSKDGEFIVWGVIHKDVLQHLNASNPYFDCSILNLDDQDFELMVKV